jgi:ureidoglycolate dehydrogenase (NAD+)
MRTIAADALRAFAQKLLVAVQVPEPDARTIADSLVESNLRGIDTHGVTRLKVYVERIEKGLVKARPEMKFRKTRPGTGVLDGDCGQGQVVTCRAMDHACDLAREAGIGAVAIRNSAHFGAAAYYTVRAARKGFIGFCLGHAEADMVPFGGRRPVLGTNPISVAFPSDGEEPFTLDMATSAVPMGAVLLAAKEGRSIPSDWAVDEEGRAVTDPKAARAVKPMAGPKGYALSIVVDVLSALLSGSAYGAHIRRQYQNWKEPQQLGAFCWAVDIAAFVDPAEFNARIKSMFDEIRAVPPAEGFARVSIPGEIEAERKRERLKNGIPLSAEVADELRSTGTRLGTPFTA